MGESPPHRLYINANINKYVTSDSDLEKNRIPRVFAVFSSEIPITQWAKITQNPNPCPIFRTTDGTLGHFA
jgi:hypothetical protein